MKKEIKTTETEFDVDLAKADLVFTCIQCRSRLNILYTSIHPAIVWHETDAVKEARRISAEMKIVIDNLQNMESLYLNFERLDYDLLDIEIDRLNNLYTSIHPAIVWHENDVVKEARRISAEVESVRNTLIDIKALGHKIDAYYDKDENE